MHASTYSHSYIRTHVRHLAQLSPLLAAVSLKLHHVVQFFLMAGANPSETDEVADAPRVCVYMCRCVCIDDGDDEEGGAYM